VALDQNPHLFSEIFDNGVPDNNNLISSVVVVSLFDSLV